jgi:hypothetical protein
MIEGSTLYIRERERERESSEKKKRIGGPEGWGNRRLERKQKRGFDALRKGAWAGAWG